MSSHNARLTLRTLALWIIPTVISVIALIVYGRGGRFVDTDNAYVIRDHIDCAPEVAGTVLKVLVHENDTVTPGQELIELDSRLEIIALESARAKLSAARAEVASLKAAITEKNGEMTVASQAAEYALKDLHRQEELAAKKLTPQATVDSAHRLADISTGSIDVLKLQRAQLLAKLGLAPSTAVDDFPQVQAALAEVHHAEYQLDHTKIYAPQAGIVSHIPKVGAHLDIGRPALVIVSNQPAEIEANFKETDLEWVRVGQTVEVNIDTYAHHPMKGTVKSMAAATGAAFSLLPPQNASGNWVKVVQRIPVRIALEPTNDIPPLRDGMSAQIAIDTGAHTRFDRWFHVSTP
jgi:membrane fusion protein (multidrug efflux system)